MQGRPVADVWDDIPPDQLGRRRASRLPDAEAARPSRTHHQRQQQPERHRPRRLLRLRHGAGRGARTSAGSGSASTSRPPPAASWPSACATCATSARTRTSGGPAAASSSATCRGPRSKLRKLPPFEFENWAVIALGGIPNKAQVGDMGIDGRIFPVSATPEKRGAGRRRARLHGRLVSRSRSSRRTRSAARTSTPSRPS